MSGITKKINMQEELHMELLLVIGFLALTYAVLYLPYHFIRKIKDKERVLPKKSYFIRY